MAHPGHSKSLRSREPIVGQRHTAHLALAYQRLLDEALKTADTHCTAAELFDLQHGHQSLARQDPFTKANGIDTADVVVANLNGLGTDDGTAWELGYAYAKGKYCIGLYTDWRMRFAHEVVNLMMGCSLDRVVRSLDELRDALREWHNR